MEQDNLKSESANDPKKGGVLGQLPPAARFRLMGEVLNLLMASTRYRKYRLQDIVVQFFPAIDLNQFMLFRTKNGPIGLVTWAFLTDEALAGYVERKEF
ncbi:toxin-activating lysine-acyltransferase, partial [bacterium]|nr:toxin-activating lysine-acyltransferase [bacterium]